MRESQIERRLVQRCEESGFRCLKLVGVNVIGFPDRTIIGPGATIFFVEVKTETGVLSSLQLRWQHVLENYGFEYFVVRSVSDVEHLMGVVAP